MFKHLADSIKENDNKQFISKAEKDKYNAYENQFRRKDDSYSKSEMDVFINELNTTYETLEGQFLSLTNTRDSYLENVELKGNTIQNAENLADIKSVGDKVEGQEMYEIPLLSVGKNLINNNSVVSGGISTSTGSFATDDSRVRTDYIKFLPNKNYFLSNIDGICFYDNNKNFIRFDRGNTGVSPSNCKYVAIRMLKETSNWQLEYDTKTSFENYQEHKLTILSPVQLEKVGTVADRIVEKDGVWGVEKNVVDYVVNGSESNISYESQLKRARIMLPNLTSKPMRSGISDKFKYDGDSHNDGGLLVHVGGVFFYNYLWTGTTSVREWLKNNNTRLIAEADNPTFIPLPHSQQVVLKTFANKTNISFLTEIEGTIKADVPKSLGATVNTHTTQIDALNKDLERVKRLEESTVSTVTTESDFTVVEQTSNGYFEDVELNGRTLVNLADTQNILLTGTVRIKHIELARNLKANTEYTLIREIEFNGATETLFNAHTTDGNVLYFVNSSTKEMYSVVTFTPSKDVDYMSVYLPTGLTEDKQLTIKHIVLLEGDHTQNPPSYFEGLASVGDGTDEIVVSSVDGYGNLVDKESDIISNSSSIQKRVTVNGRDIVTFPQSESRFYIINRKLEENTQYTVSLESRQLGSTPFRIGINYTDGTSDSFSFTSTDFKLFTFTSKPNKTILNIRTPWADSNLIEVDLNTVMLNKGTTPKPYTPYKADKKKLLYFDPADDTWKKPILDEFSTVKKGSDGVYRYYKRSEKVVLDGSENWSLFNTTHQNDSIAFQCLNVIANAVSMSEDNFISDKFKFKDVYTNTVNEEGLMVHINIIRVSIFKTKLTTPDVAGFKAWLQANPVTVVYRLATEQVYECTNIDLITYPGETNYTVKSGVLCPKTTMRLSQNIGNIVVAMQKKVSLLESKLGSRTITQNRLLLNSTYSADNTTLKLDIQVVNNGTKYASIDEDLYYLLLANIIPGKENYDRVKMEEMIDFYTMIGKLSFESSDELFMLIEAQYAPPIVEEIIPEEEHPAVTLPEEV